LPPALQPPLLIAVDGTTTAGPPRLIALAPGEALQIVLRPDRLLVQGDPAAASLAVRPGY
jgi:hypothetical protein